MDALRPGEANSRGKVSGTTAQSAAEGLAGAVSEGYLEPRKFLNLMILGLS